VAGTSLLALIDDIATVLDDIAVMTKVAAKKTAGVLGDDLALNAEQVSGVRADRELPVVWGVAKGSMKNKLILVPAALTVSALAPALITPILMLGGAFLCLEGFEKLVHTFLHSVNSQDEHSKRIRTLSDPDVDLIAFEKEKIQGAIRTDFILSAEIIVISLGTVKDAPLSSQVIVVTSIAFIMTVGVYSLVAGIVKLDDVGLYLVNNRGTYAGADIMHALGKGLLRVAPHLMKMLSIVGTIAMFMVGGGILLHGVPVAQTALHHVVESIKSLPALGEVLATITPSAITLLAGIVVGGLALVLSSMGTTIITKFKRRHA
jgi:predicted DNA repair protein MutK